MMFALGIRYLMGWAMAASDGAKKERTEWPPHPDRIFMALSAAWFETGQSEDEGEALRWLEQQQPPGIYASEKNDRLTVTSFVPVNDTSIAGTNTVNSVCNNPASSFSKYKETGLSMLPEYRSRQPRAFPVAVPHDPTIHLVWQEDLPTMHHEPLAALCRKVTSVGHSASLVQIWLNKTPPAPNLVPQNGVARCRLRVFSQGRLRYLEERFNHNAVIEFLKLDEKIKSSKGKDKKILQARQQSMFPDGRPVSLRPEPGRWQGYDHPKPVDMADKPHSSLFDPHLVILTLTGKQLSLPATLKVTETLRGALFAACPDPLPEWLTGHTPDGTPSKKPHISFVPLPFTGSHHADGRLMGIALVLPKELDVDEVDRLLSPWLWDEFGEPRKIRLFDGQWLECSAVLETRETPPHNLCTQTWVEASRQWATVTPVVLDRHFDGADKWERAAESVKDGCERIGLPRPATVLLHPVSMLEGVPRSNEFPWITRKKDGGRMHHTHAMILFNKAVQGPIIVGAGRFRGYGFCRPLRQGGDYA